MKLQIEKEFPFRVALKEVTTEGLNGTKVAQGPYTVPVGNPVFHRVLVKVVVSKGCIGGMVGLEVSTPEVAQVGVQARSSEYLN